MNFKPCSLAQLFDPPDDYQGAFGWICGYSADAGFLEDAVERFSGLTKAQREHQGRMMLAVMLDPGNPQILPSEVPAVLHLPIKSSPLPFLLLHAKVAVLGFEGAGRFLLRVIVTTGNWTRQTLEESLDLAWYIDVEDKPSESSRQERTDLATVWSFLAWVRSHFDTRPLDLAVDPSNESAGAVEKIAAWATQLGTRHRGYRSRFFDNRDASLLRQMPDLIKHHVGPTARNYLALGSGPTFQIVSSLILSNTICLPRALTETCSSIHGPAKLSQRGVLRLKTKVGISGQRAPPNILAVRHGPSMRSLCSAAPHVAARTTAQVRGSILARAISPTRVSNRRQAPTETWRLASSSFPRI